MYISSSGMRSFIMLVVIDGKERNGTFWGVNPSCTKIICQICKLDYAKNTIYIKYVPKLRLVTADSSWAASSIDVLLVQYAKNSLVEREMWSAVLFRVSCLLSPRHSSLGMRIGSGALALSAFFMAARRSERRSEERRKAISMFGT